VEKRLGDVLPLLEAVDDLVVGAAGRRGVSVRSEVGRGERGMTTDRMAPSASGWWPRVGFATRMLL